MASEHGSAASLASKASYSVKAKRSQSIVAPDFESVTLNSVVVLKLLRDVKTLMATSTGAGSDLSVTVENLTIAVDALTVQVDCILDKLKFIYDHSTIVGGPSCLL